MDFEDTKEESAFREQARTWLQANAPTEAEMSGHGHNGSCQVLAKSEKQRVAGRAFVGRKHFGGA